MNILFMPWSTLAPKGALLVVDPEGERGRVEPGRPPCIDEHETAYTGYGFGRHPAIIVRVCVRCWVVLSA